MPGQMILKIWDVQHGACAMLTHWSMYGIEGRLAMIDSGHHHDTGWKPSAYIKHYLRRDVLDYLFVTNADLDHISDLNNLSLRRGEPQELPLVPRYRCDVAAASARAARGDVCSRGRRDAHSDLSRLVLGQYLVTAFAARTTGIRLVQNVLAVHASRNVTV